MLSQVAKILKASSTYGELWLVMTGMYDNFLNIIINIDIFCVGPEVQWSKCWETFQVGISWGPELDLMVDTSGNTNQIALILEDFILLT